MNGVAFDREKAKALLKHVESLALSRGLKLPPPDPYPDQQVLYERYLRSMGIEPGTVDIVLDLGRIPKEKHPEIHGMILSMLTNVDSMPQDELRTFLLMVRTIFSEQRASELIRTLTSPIFESARGDVPLLRRPLAMGVFPFAWFNGHSTLFEGSPICLLATGSFDLIEIFTTLFMANMKDPIYAVDNLREHIDHYVRASKVKKPEYGLGANLVDFGDYSGVGTRLTTSAEQFLMSHELAHVALGHVDRSPRAALPILNPAQVRDRTVRPIPSAISVINPGHIDEHCADVWALTAMLKIMEDPKHKEEAPLLCGGAAVFLGIAMLVEAAAQQAGLPIPDSHPPAHSRLYIIELAFELLGQHENAFVARRVSEFVAEVGRAYDSFEMPPMLDRSQNKVAAEVFRLLGVDLSEAPYITDFQ